MTGEGIVPPQLAWLMLCCTIFCKQISSWFFDFSIRSFKLKYLKRLEFKPLPVFLTLTWLQGQNKFFPFFIPRPWCVFFSFIFWDGRIGKYAKLSIFALECYKVTKLWYDTHLSWPLTMIPTREHKASASSMEWVVRMAPRFPWTFLLMVFLIRWNRESETFSTHKREIAPFERSRWRWRQTMAYDIIFCAKPAKRISRTISVLARKNPAKDDRRFGKRFRRENKDKLAINVWPFGTKTAKRIWRMTDDSARNNQATFDSYFHRNTAKCLTVWQYSPIFVFVSLFHDILHNKATYFLTTFKSVTGCLP